MKRRPAPSVAEINAAFTAAGKGKGRKLAQLVKSFSLEDLSAAFSAQGPALDRWEGEALRSALAYAAGRKECRELWAAGRRQARKRSPLQTDPEGADHA
ncbi:hypothetical protein [Telmatospirillum sp. J64-1]|uniref:hypothetical protein n=1 Tax=Telmatospirillum sp. J64-1 TaxID=2502183 RepID=UPI00163DCCAC|nr:hypothetical protein [Telmatospirillum sp. J64-1]